MTEQTERAEVRPHYLYVNMRDIGCNCGERAPDGVLIREDRDAWFAEHMDRVAQPRAARAAARGVEGGA